MKPEKEFRAGPISAVIWLNQRDVDGETVSIPSVQIQKRFKDGDKWRRTSSFAVEDLPRVAMLATEAYKYTTLKTREPSQSSE